MGRRQEIPDSELGGWLEREIAGCRFEDARHGKRFRTLPGAAHRAHRWQHPIRLSGLGEHQRPPIDFLRTKEVSDDKILAGHFACTQERFEATVGGPLLVLHDTTEFIYRREENEAIGMVSKQQTSV